MFGLIITLVFVAIAGYAAYNAKTPTGWDWKKGALAVVALGAAIWTWISGLFQSTPPV